MSHARKQIRDAIVALLQTAPTYGTHVTADRVYNIDAAALPGLNVVDVDESVDFLSLESYERKLTVQIECRAQGTETTIDDTLDAMAAEVETLLDLAQPAGVALMQQTGSRKTLDGGGSKPTGLLAIDYTAHYVTARGATETII